MENTLEIEVPTFCALRASLAAAGLIPATCREMSPYYYSSNRPNGCRERSPGHVANWVRKEWSSLRGETAPAMPACSWAGKWPRTLDSQARERQGNQAFWSMVGDLQKAGKLPQVAN